MAFIASPNSLKQGCQDRAIDREIVRSYASNTAHRARAIQRSEETPERWDRRGRASNRGRSDLPRVVPIRSVRIATRFVPTRPGRSVCDPVQKHLSGPKTTRFDSETPCFAATKLVYALLTWGICGI
ncbi:hypothetical protein QL285_023485 [Trifolium repens]|nr:hypothetical protein QL285_023485 [Trifolium repens]